MLYFQLDAAGLQKALTAEQGNVRRSIIRGLNAGGDKVRTRVQRALKEQTNVKLYRSITSRVATRRAHEGFLAYWIIVNGRALPIDEFPVTVTAQGVDAKTWGVDHLFARSFQQKFQGGLRARRGASRLPTRMLLGPSLAKEAENDKGRVPDVFYVGTSTDVMPTIVRAIARGA